METETVGDVLIVTLPSRMDATKLKEIEGPFVQQVAAHNGSVLVDLSQVDFLASLALRMLLMQQKEQQQTGRALSLSGLRPQIADVFRKTRFDTMFPIYTDRSTALQSLAA